MKRTYSTVLIHGFCSFQASIRGNFKKGCKQVKYHNTYLQPYSRHYLGGFKQGSGVMLRVQVLRLQRVSKPDKVLDGGLNTRISKGCEPWKRLWNNSKSGP